MSSRPVRPSVHLPAARPLRAAKLLASLAALIATSAWPLVAWAQEFQKVEGKASQEVPAVPFVGIAYGFIWIAILAYVFFVARAVNRVRGEVADLRRKIDGAGAPR